MSANHASPDRVVAFARVEKIPASAQVRPAVTLEQLKLQTEKRAKEIFQARSKANTSGDALSDWLQAEKEIKAKLGIKG